MADLRPYLISPGTRQREVQQAHLSYQMLVEDAVRQGRPTPPPNTKADLEWLAREYPIRARQFTRDSDLPMLGISRHIGRKIEPLPIEFIERLLVSLNDPDVAAAFEERLEAARV